MVDETDDSKDSFLEEFRSYILKNFLLNHKLNIGFFQKDSEESGEVLNNYYLRLSQEKGNVSQDQSKIVLLNHNAIIKPKFTHQYESFMKSQELLWANVYRFFNILGEIVPLPMIEKDETNLFTVPKISVISKELNDDLDLVLSYVFDKINGYQGEDRTERFIDDLFHIPESDYFNGKLQLQLYSVTNSEKPEELFVYLRTITNPYTQVLLGIPNQKIASETKKTILALEEVLDSRIPNKSLINDSKIPFSLIVDEQTKGFFRINSSGDYSKPLLYSRDNIDELFTDISNRYNTLSRKS